MKGRKLYLGLIFILSLSVVYLLEAMAQDKGIALGNVIISDDDRPQEWQQLIASDVSSNALKLQVDGVDVEFNKNQLYMEENLDIMIPADIFRSTFKCAFNYADEYGLELQKGNTVVSVSAGGSYITVDGEKIYLENAMKKAEDGCYINARVLEAGFGYTYKWDSGINTLSLVDTRKDESYLPSKYSYFDVGRLGKIKDQGIYGTCWAFAALTAVETSLMPEETYDFSEDNMVWNSGYFGSKYDGGDYTRAVAYLTSWKGPVLEEDDIYGDGENNPDAEVKKHVQEAQIIESKNLEAIKRAVFLYGGVESSLYTSMSYVGESSMYYNDKNFSYCYIGTNKPNHDVVIVGWDDNYPKENFSVNLEGDGAFLCVNSWGEDFGDNGLFYVSYYDSNIGIHNVVYTRVEDTHNYDNIYQTDLCGWVGQLGYENETAYFSNVYTAEADEELKAVGFYATGKDTSYEIYYVDGFEGTDSFGDKIYLQSGKFVNEGYYTVDLDSSIMLEAGKKYAIVIKITTPGAVHPIAIEYRAGRSTKNVVLDDGEGYISLIGKTWEHVEESKECNICLKMYTNTRMENKSE